MTIDHIKNDGSAHRKEVGASSLYRWLRKRGYPRDNFQLLCMNCNFSKGRYGNCPHEVARYELPFAVNVPQEEFA